ncbi:putative cytochrome P450 304a1 [Frankliniella fusca]|uniref:Cytochrome P450 304a1 n=1 Tax=Frankliniella fusca TaxID=407009 RepID=A0AAE1GTC0_9NEOP|nr:putative cytochrome P450 304a1 [Frankliniella fusca]
MSPILLALFVVALVACLVRYARSRPPDFPPGPLRLPVWGNLWQLLLRNNKYPMKAMAALAKEYGGPLLGLYLGDYPMLVANDLETVRDMFSHPAFQGRPDSFSGRVRASGRLHGIFFTDGPYWEEQRRFSLRHMRDYGFGRRFERLEAVVLEEVQGVVNVLRGCITPHDADVARAAGADGVRSAHFPDVLAAAAMNMGLAVLTGTRLPADQYPAARVVARHVQDFQRSGNAGGRAIDVTPWLRFVAPGASGYATWKSGNDGLLEFIKEHVQDHKESFDAEVIRGFCDKYLSEMKQRIGEDSSFSEMQMVLILMDYLFPTATAVPSAITFAVIFMMHHPDLADRAHEEIKNVVGLDRLPDLNDRANLPYTEAFLRETLRLTGTPLAVTHRATEDSYFRGYYIPKNTFIVPNTWAAHRDPKVFEKPDEFRPERFLQQNGQLKKKDPTLSFGLGKRLCAGETFARQNLFMFLAALLQNFRFRMPEGVPVPEPEEDALFGLIMTPTNEMWIEVSDRS